MKKLIFFLIIAGGVTGAYYLMQNYYQKEDVAIWDLVPKNTLLVYETTEPLKVWNSFLTLPFWENLRTIPELNKFGSDLADLDTMTVDNGGLSRLFQDRNMLLSFHKVSNTDLGIVFYISINSTFKRKILNTILSSYREKEGVMLEKRNYEGFTINEMQSHDQNNSFTYIEYKDFFIGSFTSVLIDDIIRNVAGKFEINFRTNAGNIFDNKPIVSDEGNIYFNMKNLKDLLRVFSDPVKNHYAGDMIHNLANSSYYDISFEGNRIFLNGSSSISPGGTNYFLGTFYNQEPQLIDVINYLPNFTASYLGYTFSDFTGWRQAVDNYWQINSPALLDEKIDFFQEYDILEKDLYRWIGNEIGLATLRSINIDNPEKLLFVKANNVDEGIRVLEEITLFVNHANGDTLLVEEYADKEIIKLNIKEFPARIFGNSFEGFEASYYTVLDEFVIIGNSFDAIKVMLNDIEDENTWGKSLKFVQFFDNIQKKSNMTFIINYSNAWNTFYGSLNDRWQDFVKKYDHQFKHFELISCQFSNINNNFYTSAAVQHRSQTSLMETPARFFKEQVVVTDYPIITKPFVVRNHLDRSLEVILQDSADYLYLIGSEGDVLWKDSIGDPIVGDIHQVDFYKNDKLQYFFATRTGLHIIDRNGDYVSGFPQLFDDPMEMKWVNLIDYDNSRRYRFLLADQSGNIYLYNKHGEILEGWDPMVMSGPFSSTPFHVRVGGRDCMLNIESNGKINMLTRRGEYYDGFPVTLEGGIKSQVFIQRGTDFNNTLIHLVDENGKLIKLNFRGETVDQSQLYRTGAESYFEIIPDVLNNTYIIARQDFNNISILHPDGEEVFERELLFSDKLKLQYYNFSAGNEIYIVTDAQQAFTYIFDAEGNLINRQPVESGHEVGLIFSEVNNNYKLYSCYGNQFSISTYFRR